MGEEAKKVVVIQDASRDVNLTTIRLALEGFSLKAGDTLILLGVLHQVNNPMGIKVRIDPSLMFGVNPKYIAEEVDRKTEEYINNAEIMNISKLCEMGQIEFRVEVHAGSTPKIVSVEAARNFRATWVILDSQMKKDVKYFMEKLPCGISRMKRDNTIEQLRAPNPRRSRKLLSQKGENQETADTTNNDKEKVIYDEAIPNVVASSEPPSSPSASSVKEFHVDPSREISQQDYRKGNPYSKSSPSDQPIMTAVSTSSWDYDDDLSSNIRQAKDYYMNFLKENTTDAEKDSTREPSPASIVESQAEEKEAYDTVSPNEQQKQPKEADDWMGGPDEECENSVCSVCKNRRPKIRWTSEFTYAELHAATEGFHPCNFLSEGDFGAVYKGNLNGLKIAVKQRKDAGIRGEKEFKSEVEVLSKARHENLVMLLGSCSEGSNRLLVYEYVCNGSLDQHLSKHARRPLSWEKRMKIAMGVAKGLQYLHENNIIHRDMRPSNILITHDYEALLGDFGLARTQHEGSDHSMETKVIGTLGYVAPEYAECGKISSKTDVYSFGVVLLQLITGLKTTDKKTLGGKSLVGWARPLLKERKYPDLIDPRIIESHDVHQLFWLVRVAEKCLSKDPHKRLTMDKVVFALDHIMKSSKLGRVADISPAKSDSASSSKISYESPDDDTTFTIDTTSSNADSKSTRSISHLSVRHPPTPPIRRRPPSPTRLITNSTSRLSRIPGSGGDDEKSISM